ncbi:MAG: hypothetical protein AAFV49_17540 [Pseudomonadota bacterium]
MSSPQIQERCANGTFNSGSSTRGGTVQDSLDCRADTEDALFGFQYRGVYLQEQPSRPAQDTDDLETDGVSHERTAPRNMAETSEDRFVF